MIRGLSGSLLSHDALIGGELIARTPQDGRTAAAVHTLRRWHQPVRAALGPTATARIVFDRVAAPLFAQLGFSVVPDAGRGPYLHAVMRTGGRVVSALVVTAWGADPGAAWRDAVRHGIAHDVRWCFVVNGPAIRIHDARRSYSRRHAEFDLSDALDDPDACRMFYLLLNASAAAAAPGRAALDRAVARSERFRTEVRGSLQHGVHSALSHLLAAFSRASSRRAPDPSGAFDESLMVVYRVLFLLFAEARGLVPRWHPTFRESYTIECLREMVETDSRPRGLWEALQAIARMAHKGCHAGSLHVPPFNGRLFSPAEAPLADALRLDDGAVREALLALTTRTGSAGRQRISYGDLGVEQLGGIYEQLLDFQSPSVPAAGAARGHGERRRSTGSFYTPRSLTEYLARRTLAPLAERAAPGEILSLRVLDPAMGSGAFLVAACRYLASAYEQALVREGFMNSGDIDDRDRAGFRRTVAQRCLFGVDINPMAVQLGRLSLWLATLAADRPLTFLDHHLRSGNSLVGAAVADLLRQPPGRSRAASRAPLPLFPTDDLDGVLGAAVGSRIAIASEPGDTIEQVRAKEGALARLTDPGAALARWKRAADLWCAAWFSQNPALTSRTSFGALLDEVVSGRASLPDRVAGPLREAARATADRVRPFHWTLEFPEVFYGEDGSPLVTAGFDAVLGNPPWAMLRGERGDLDQRRRAHADGEALTAFARAAGVYRVHGSGHANLYQIFLERALSLVRHGGRLGLVLPSGFSSDAGCSALRRHVLDRLAIDSFVGIENRDAVFPIHRGLKFLLVSGSTGAATATLPCRFGVRSPEALDGMPDSGPQSADLEISRALIQPRPDCICVVPELRTQEDLTVFSAIALRVPPLGSPEGWNLRFGRELNATDDRRHFNDARRGLPVIEGKQLQPFAIDVDVSRRFITPGAAARLLDPDRSYGRPRLAYRDVASASNRLTLIAAIVPAGVVTTHTLFCLRDEPRRDLHLFLCGVFNSYVANYLVRLRVGTHVTAGIIEWLPVPLPSRASTEFGAIVRDTRHLIGDPRDRPAAARLQAACASLYGLTAQQFGHVLDTFPLVAAADRRLALDVFEARSRV